MMSDRRLKRVGWLAAGLLLAAASAHARQITLAWDANPEPSIVGYRVYYGIEPGVYTELVDVSNAITWSADLPGPQYYFAVRAYDADGNMSPPSLEVGDAADVLLTNPGNQSSAPGTDAALPLIATGSTFAYSALNLPPDLGVNAKTGWITGTVGSTADPFFPYLVTARVSDRGGYFSSVQFFWTVNGGNATPLEGRMFGCGRIDDGHTRHRFAFRMTERNNREYGRLEYWLADDRNDDGVDGNCDGDGDRDYGRAHHGARLEFVSTAITSVTFSDDPAFTPGRGSRQPTADSVVFAGAGKWNGKAGYTFEVRATDQGEPGRQRDTFSIVVKDSRGAVVANVAGKLDSGNIESTRLSKRGSDR